jgi:tRNA(adenine34) deaminase
MPYIPKKSAEQDLYFMELALQAAGEAGERGEVPVGAVLVDETGTVLALDGNRSIGDSDPSGHAEMVVLRQAGKKRGNYRLLNTTLYVTIEPCVMCVGALIHARVGRLVFGAPDPKGGAVVSLYRIGSENRLNHQLEIEGYVLADRCATLLSSFFRNRRRKLHSPPQNDTRKNRPQ